MSITKQITPCLWFDTQAEEAADFYISVFKNSSKGNVSHYTEAGQEAHEQKPGTVMLVEFTIEGQPFTALNGGPAFKFNEAISFQIPCETQEEIDYYWEKLSEGGEENVCGWLKDKYGVSWQVFPRILPELLSSPDPEKAKKAMEAMIQMKKIDLEAIKQAVA